MNVVLHSDSECELTPAHNLKDMYKKYRVTSVGIKVGMITFCPGDLFNWILTMSGDVSCTADYITKI